MFYENIKVRGGKDNTILESLFESPGFLCSRQLQPEPVDRYIGEHEFLPKVGDLFPHLRPSGVERPLRPLPPLLEVRLVFVGVQSHRPRCRQESVDILRRFLHGKE